jgi:hypothetical protein
MTRLQERDFEEAVRGCRPLLPPVTAQRILTEIGEALEGTDT